MAVESERIRLEAEQRALEQIRAEAEAAKHDITTNITQQCHLELQKLKADFEAQLKSKDAELERESASREKALRQQYEEELARSKAMVEMKDGEVQVWVILGMVNFMIKRSLWHCCYLKANEAASKAELDTEKTLRETLEKQLVALRAEYSDRLEREEEKKKAEQQEVEVCWKGAHLFAATSWDSQWNI